MSEAVTIQIGDELVATIDAATLDFTDLTPAELRVIAALTEGDYPLMIDGEPTVFMGAALIAIKASRGRQWDRNRLWAVIEVVGAWLAGELTEVT